jgi:hypothetical protein
LLDPVYRVEKVPAIHPELPAAQLPVCSQKEMGSKDFLFLLIQNPLADQAEIRHEFLFFSRISAAAFLAAAEFERNRAGMCA